MGGQNSQNCAASFEFINSGLSISIPSNWNGISIEKDNYRYSMHYIGYIVVVVK